jgi:hypothetical protein
MAGAAMALVATGCGRPSVDDVCESLEETDCATFNVQECVREGKELEERAVEKDCAGTFDSYIDCIDEMRCRWEIQCAPKRADLESCVGTFPP